jgi:hypothetical protein
MGKAGKRPKAKSGGSGGVGACLCAISLLPDARQQAKAAGHLFARRGRHPVRQNDATAIAIWVSQAAWQPQLKAHVLARLLADVDPADAFAVLTTALRALDTRAAWNMVALLLVHTTAGSTNLLGPILEHRSEGPGAQWNEELYLSWVVLLKILFKDAVDHPVDAFGPHGSAPWKLLLQLPADRTALVAIVAAAKPMPRTTGVLLQVISAVQHPDLRPHQPICDSAALFIRARDAIRCLEESMAPGYLTLTKAIGADPARVHIALDARTDAAIAELQTVARALELGSL